MKRRYVVRTDSGYDSAGIYQSRRQIKTFRNEPDAIAFYNDPKNVREHGCLFLEMIDKNGELHDWDDTRKEWL